MIRIAIIYINESIIIIIIIITFAIWFKPFLMLLAKWWILSSLPKPIPTHIWCLASANFGPCQQGSLNLDTQKVYY